MSERGRQRGQMSNEQAVQQFPDGYIDQRGTKWVVYSFRLPKEGSTEHYRLVETAEAVDDYNKKDRALKTEAEICSIIRQVAEHDTDAK